MEKVYKKYEKIRPAAEKLARKYSRLLASDLDISTICFCKVSGSGRSRFLARCYRVIEPYYTIMDEKYMFIILYNTDKMKLMMDIAKLSKKGRTDYIKAITLHELMHIGEEGSLVKHDIEDFSILLRRFGINWVHGKLEGKI